MKLSPKQILIVIAIVFILLISIGVWFYLKGKKTVTIQKPPLDNPDPNNPNNPYSVSSGEITSIVSALHEDMDGFNYYGHNSEPYEKLNSLSDTDFVNTYNTFNTMYQVASGQTLKQWIESESYAFDDVTTSILDRMGRLNLI